MEPLALIGIGALGVGWLLSERGESKTPPENIAPQPEPSPNPQVGNRTEFAVFGDGTPFNLTTQTVRQPAIWVGGTKHGAIVQPYWVTQQRENGTWGYITYINQPNGAKLLFTELRFNTSNPHLFVEFEEISVIANVGNEKIITLYPWVVEDKNDGGEQLKIQKRKAIWDSAENEYRYLNIENIPQYKGWMLQPKGKISVFGSVIQEQTAGGMWTKWTENQRKLIVALENFYLRNQIKSGQIPYFNLTTIINVKLYDMRPSRFEVSSQYPINPYTETTPMFIEKIGDSYSVFDYEKFEAERTKRIQIQIAM